MWFQFIARLTWNKIHVQQKVWWKRSPLY
jgi:hypothetical protein